MSAQQITTRPSDAATEAPGYGLAHLRAAVLADRGATVAARAALGVLLAVAAVILVAGVASQFVLAMIVGGIGIAVLVGALVSLARGPSNRSAGDGRRATVAIRCRGAVSSAGFTPPRRGDTSPCRPFPVCTRGTRSGRRCDHPPGASPRGRRRFGHIGDGC